MNKAKLSIFAIALSASVGIHASPITIVDTTSTGAVVDGTVGGSEYVGNSSGINSGFGDVWGATSELHIDSDLSGNLFLGFVKGPGTFDNVSVIYFDTKSGGFGDTIGMDDNADPARAAISGDGTGGGFSDLTFAPTFDADFAIAWEGGTVNLFELAGTSSSHNYLATLGGATNEVSFNLSSIGLSAGDSFDYFATYLNPVNAYRSDEFHGVASASGIADGGPNIGNNSTAGGGTFTLSAGDFNTFQSIPEPATLGLILSGFGLIALIRRFRS